MRVFITGATGFAGSHLVELLTAQGDDVYGLVRPVEMENLEKQRWGALTPLKGDLLDESSLKEALKRAQPDVIYHLAGQADVASSWKIPAQTLYINAGGTINLLEATVAYGTPRIVAVTSAEVYGPQSIEAMPIREETRPNPNHPYAISKVAASQILQLYHKRYMIEIVEARPFNHIGPRQALGFVVPDFASQVAAIRLGHQSGEMKVGNLEAQRDFTDVRDVVRAYTLLAEKGTPGEQYLICSGKPVSIQRLLDDLIAIADIKVVKSPDEKRLRPSDTPCLYGDFNKLWQATGWEPEIPLTQSLTDVYHEWLRKLGSEGA